MKNVIRAIAVGVASVALGGCGGGGGGSDGDADDGFTVSAMVAGTPVPGFNVADGQSGKISVDSGQEIVLTSSAAVTWTLQPSTAVVATQVKPTTDTVLDGTLVSPPGGDIILTVKKKDDPSVSATITATVAPEHFNAKAAAVGDHSNLHQVDTLVNGSSTTTTVSRLTTAVAGDGSSSSIDAIDASAVVTDHFIVDASGNRTSRTYVNNGNVCTYAPSREYLNFPMFVGKTWASTWQYSCVLGYKETANQTATVEAWEPVTVTAGTFDALRVRINTTYTNSNDANLTNGSAGSATYAIALVGWYAPSTGSYVKYQFNYTYTGTQPPSYLASEEQDLAP